MNFRFGTVERLLRRTASRWKWLRFLQHSATLGGILCVLALLLGAGMGLGWITSEGFVMAVIAFTAVGGLVAWIVIALNIIAGSAERTWLADALERSDSRLLDRLNTLVFLEKQPRSAGAHSFLVRIGRQTQRLLNRRKSPFPFPRARPLLHLLCFAGLLVGTLWVYQRYTPWERLLALQRAKSTRAAQPETPADLFLPTANSVEEKLSWGEVRITEPGGDLRVTKVDVVPLQIEAAANQALQKVGWASTVNGAAETPHDLPPPAEPRYAVYQPTLYLDELRLADWDVVTYYAKASTENHNAYASEVYFLEVRPFREDILKLPGGESGKAYQCLNEMTALMERQQHIIRQTHQHVQRPPAQPNLRDQDRHKLADAESDLGQSVKHLYARMATQLENAPIGEALDNLAKAEKSLARAGDQLREEAMDEAQGTERTGLAELIAARKSFQKAVSDNPDAFDGPKDDEPTPVADQENRLKEIAEFRNEARAAREFVDKAVEQQRQLTQRARSTPQGQHPRLAEEERKLQQSLSEFREQHPRPFRPTQREFDESQQALARAAESLEKKSNSARADTQEAAKQLERLRDTMKNQAAERQLVDAHRLRQMLEQQRQTFGQCQAAPGSVPEADLQGTVAEARQTLNELRRVAEEEPTREAFGPPLREALSGTNKVELDTRLGQLARAQGDEAKSERAGAAKEGLAKVSKAFDESLPQAMRLAQQRDALKPGEQEAFALGLQQLQSLIKRLEEAKISPQDRAKQGAEAFYNLQTGLRQLYGSNERGHQILLRLEQALKEEGLDPGDLMRLARELQHFSMETADQLALREDKPEVMNIDPARLPAAYRGRIQKYFQKLSEK